MTDIMTIFSFYLLFKFIPAEYRGFGHHQFQEPVMLFHRQRRRHLTIISDSRGCPFDSGEETVIDPFPPAQPSAFPVERHSGHQPQRFSQHVLGH